MDSTNQILQLFQTRFTSLRKPRIFRAPGRVNLIGDHTDYNDGFVLPAAIDRQILLAAAPRTDDQVNVYSHNFGQWDRFNSRAEIAPLPENGWGNYLRAMLWSLMQNGYAVTGMDAVIDSDIPMGAGLSSSAALEVVTGFALLTLIKADVSLPRLALMAQQAENEFVGMRCGIMDQFIACLGHPQQALLIDCRDLSYRAVPLPTTASIVIVDSGVHRGLRQADYNTRRKECESAATYFGVPKLRDVTREDFEKNALGLSQTVRCRARHVISENQRTLAAEEALNKGDATTMGKLMTASHASLRDDFQVSCAELDQLVAIALATDGVHGARMTGGGFGGCMVALVETMAVNDFIATIERCYAPAGGLQANAYVCRPSAGVSELPF